MDPFEKPKKTIRFAREALHELELANADFFSEKIRPPSSVPTKPYSIVEYVEPDHFIYVFKMTAPYPGKMERLASEIINNGKNAFDQAIYSACAALNKLPKEGNIHMPWSMNPKEMSGRVEKSDRIPPELRPAIYAQEPYFTGDGYPGGDDVVRQIAKLANDKHTLGFSINATGRIRKHPSMIGTGLTEVFIHLPDQWVSKKDEVFIAQTNRKAALGYNYIVDFQVALDVPGPAGQIPATLALDKFLKRAESLLEALQPLI